MREIKFRPKIAEHDYDTKKHHVERFLRHKDKVKVTIMFRGREVTHPERGTAILDRLAEELSEVGVVEQRPMQEGRNMTMMMAPSKAVLAGRSSAEDGEIELDADAVAAGATDGAPPPEQSTSVDAEPPGRAMGMHRPAPPRRQPRPRPSRRRTATGSCSRAPPMTVAPRPPARPCHNRRSAMPKMKTHSGAKKRFKVTAKGKVRGRHPFTSHILEKKSPKRSVPSAARRSCTRTTFRDQADARGGQQVTRVKRSVHARKKRRSTLEQTKGFRGEAKSNYKRAKEALIKADTYAYRDRRNRKRDFRRLWITRINAAARINGMSYSQFMHGLSWPASSWTARSSRTSRSATPTPSDLSPRSPERRRLPDFAYRQPTRQPRGRRSLKGSAPFLSPALPEEPGQEHQHEWDPHPSRTRG